MILLAAAGLLGLLTLWQAGEIWLLHLVPSSIAIRQLFTRLEKASLPLLPGLPRGHTPYELQAALVDRLARVKKGLIRVALEPAPGEIRQMVALYVLQTFSQYPPSRSQICRGIRSWSRLRWMLRIAAKMK